MADLDSGIGGNLGQRPELGTADPGLAFDVVIVPPNRLEKNAELFQHCQHLGMLSTRRHGTTFARIQLAR